MPDRLDIHFAGLKLQEIFASLRSMETILAEEHKELDSLYSLMRGRRRSLNAMARQLQSLKFEVKRAQKQLTTQTE